ncbi:hypothetical protein F66182_8650 [Fusarium sp. NRRL 66182]|nr:hypothetical protein F66182_8650 [Fusarium sp. NRRL 66182]
MEAETTPVQWNAQLSAASTSANIFPQQFDAIVEHCKKYLQKEWRHQRIPRGYSNAWKELHSLSDTSSTAVAFYKAGGYQAWLAYFLTTCSARESRSFRTSKLEALDNFPSEIKASIARELARASVHATVATAMRKLQEKVPVPYRPGLDSPSPSPSCESDDEVQAGVTARSMLHHASIDPPHRYNYASPSKVAEWFPHKVTSSILLHQNSRVLENGEKVIEEKFAIAMTFPAIPVKADCVMHLAIIPNKIQRFAQELFGAELEMEGRFRYLVLPNGTRILPNTEHTFVECQANAIGPMFESKPTSALNTSEYRQLEIRQGKLKVTGCVSMTVPADADMCATLTLNLDLTEASLVRDAFYST